MRRHYLLAVPAILLILFFSSALADNLKDNYQYTNPLPGAKLVSKATSIILRTGDFITPSELSRANQVQIIGDQSGEHGYNLIVADDNKTMILKPRHEFTPGENVTVYLPGNNMLNFTISPKTQALLSAWDWDEIYSEFYNDEIAITPSNNGLITDIDDNLPSDFPIINVPVNDNPAPGYVFLSNHGQDYGASSYLLILDNDGSPVYYKKLERLVNDFKLSRNNLITYCEFARGGTFDNVFYAMDQTYAVVDSFRMGNGYTLDQHGFKLLDNYHTLMIAYDPQTVDMSEIVEGGDPAAIVIGLIIQEQDTERNVIFEWRSWDHFNITDTPFLNLQGHRIDYVHGNSIDTDIDGNIIISSRSLHEVTKIDRITGDVIWRLGKNAINNDFTIVGDTAGFTCQHHARILDNGHLTLYDNGNYHTPSFSRAVEYELDQVNMTCTQVWEYRNDPEIYGSSRGSAQRLDNGNTVIGWGGGAGTTISEVRSDGSKAFELNIGDPVVQTSYRAYRFPWNGISNRPYLMAEQTENGIHLIFDQFGDHSITSYAIYAGQSPDPAEPIDTTTDNYYYLEDLPGGLTYYLRVTGIDYSGIEGDYSNEIEVTIPNIYIPGDNNYSGGTNGSDVTYLVNYFRGTNPKPDSSWNADDDSWLYAAADVNGSCNVTGSDVTYLVNFFRGMNELKWCEHTAPFGYDQ